MNFYTGQHRFYCGIDLHARKMYLCILDQKGEIRLHRNIDTDRQAFLKAIEPFREDIVVAVECMFTWYWIADLCQKEGISFVLGHALYMKAIHGGKQDRLKKDRFPSERGTYSHVICLPREDAGHKGSYEKKKSSYEKKS